MSFSVRRRFAAASSRPGSAHTRLRTAQTARIFLGITGMADMELGLPSNVREILARIGPARDARAAISYFLRPISRSRWSRNSPAVIGGYLGGWSAETKRSWMVRSQAE